MNAFEEYPVDGMADERGARCAEQWPAAAPVAQDLWLWDPPERLRGLPVGADPGWGPQGGGRTPGGRGDGAGLRRGRLERQRCGSAQGSGEFGGFADAFPDWPARDADDADGADGVLRVPVRDMPC
ncbi:hypothetical protein ACPC54_27345 [Kitasatospora sp. NPDC094028]